MRTHAIAYEKYVMHCYTVQFSQALVCYAGLRTLLIHARLEHCESVTAGRLLSSSLCASKVYYCTLACQSKDCKATARCCVLRNQLKDCGAALCCCNLIVVSWLLLRLIPQQALLLLHRHAPKFTLRLKHLWHCSSRQGHFCHPQQFFKSLGHFPAWIYLSLSLRGLLSSLHSLSTKDGFRWYWCRFALSRF